MINSVFSNPALIIVFIIIFLLALVGLVVSIFLSSLEKKEKVKDSTKSRFYALTEIDNQMRKQEPIEFDNLSLEEICTSFRSFAANKLRLYYSIEDIRKFISSLATSHIMILQGMSGTGKTSLAYAFGRFISNDSTIIPIQPMWKERTDLIGYYNEFTKKYNETPFLETIYKANYNDKIYITILDEMNIARVEYYFAELLSLLEIPDSEARRIEIVSSLQKNDPKLFDKAGAIKLPDNMWFIGTANNDDSTFSISDKVYDRAMVMNLNKKASAFDAPEASSKLISAKAFIEAAKIASEQYQISNELEEKINQFDQFMQETYYISFGNRIKKQMHDYLAAYNACGGSELEALDDFIAKKVIRKLEGGSQSKVKNNKDFTIAKINEIFGANIMNETILAIEIIALNAR